MTAAIDSIAIAWGQVGRLDAVRLRGIHRHLRLKRASRLLDESQAGANSAREPACRNVAESAQLPAQPVERISLSVAAAIAAAAGVVRSHAHPICPATLLGGLARRCLWFAQHRVVDENVVLGRAPVAAATEQRAYERQWCAGACSTDHRTRSATSAVNEAISRSMLALSRAER